MPTKDEIKQNVAVLNRLGFEVEYNDDMNLEQGMKLAIGAMKKVFGKDFDIERIDGSYIKTADKTFRKIDRDTLRKLVKKV